MHPGIARGPWGAPSHSFSRPYQAGLPALGLCNGLFPCLSFSLNERNQWSQVNETIIQICPATASCQGMGWGWGHLSHSSLIYYSQQPSESGYFPILQMKKQLRGFSGPRISGGIGRSANFWSHPRLLRISLW